MYPPETADTDITQCAPHPRRVLVVDHDPTFGALLSAAFACRGHHGQSTDRMADALRLLARDMYDPVIIDLRLSDGSGSIFWRTRSEQAC